MPNDGHPEREFIDSRRFGQVENGMVYTAEGFKPLADVIAEVRNGLLVPLTKDTHPDILAASRYAQAKGSTWTTRLPQRGNQGRGK